MTTIKTYSELLQLQSFKDRFDYVSIPGRVGQQTFGIERYLNQRLYHSREWESVCREVKIRDSFHGWVCDLAHPDHPIGERIFVHHLNPIRIKDIENSTPYLLDPEYLVCVSFATHNALHYGDYSLIAGRHEYTPRRPNDTCPWKE